MAYCTDVTTSVEYTKIMFAFRATAPDHSTSRSASIKSPVTPGSTLLGTFTAPRPGHTPILVVVGETEGQYEPVWPPTVMINKATALEERHQTITWGAAQLGIAQGVLDAVADGLLAPTDDVVVFVTVWVDPGASQETAVRQANRTAVRKAIGMAVQGRDPEAARALVARRDALRSPFYGGE